MDEAKVRKHAQAHGDAIAAGDFDRAMSDLTEDARAKVGPVAKALPRPVQRAEVVAAEPAGEEFIVRTRYVGAEDEATVEARWAEEEGRPRITSSAIV